MVANIKIIPSYDKSTCSLCEKKIDPGSEAISHSVPRAVEHFFHSNCIAQWINGQPDWVTRQLSCPECGDRLPDVQNLLGQIERLNGSFGPDSEEEMPQDLLFHFIPSITLNESVAGLPVHVPLLLPSIGSAFQSAASSGDFAAVRTLLPHVNQMLQESQHDNSNVVMDYIGEALKAATLSRHYDQGNCMKIFESSVDK